MSLSQRNAYFSLYNIVVFLCISLIMPICLGYKNVGNYILTLAILLLANTSKYPKIIILSILLLLSLYIPTGFQFGRLNYGFIISGLETDSHETVEFLHGLIGIPLVLMVVCWISLYRYSTIPLFKLSKKSKYLCLLILVALSVNSYPKRMIKDAIEYIFQSKKDLAKLEKEAFIPDSFSGVTSKSKYNNIIVVIGESVSANYLSLYGYPHDNTPWLRKTPGIFMNNYISAAPNTFLSLPRTLAMSDGIKTTVNNNVVALANKAGYETYWISNQGFVGEYDTPSTVIAMRAKHRYFLKKGDFNSKLVDDFSMLDLLPSILKKPEKKVIFIHMIGSHPDPCKRLMGYPQRFTFSEKAPINCYVSSINKLDDFLHQTYSIAEENKESFLMMYFSDHGMTTDTSDRPVRHGNSEKQNYHVPFIILSNDIKGRTDIDTPISALQFINIFENYTGINSKQISPINPSNIIEKQIKVFDGSRMVDYQGLLNPSPLY
ncbi:phosphoethanolamine transferase [Rosenbergiella epipactidis]|uniref:phosphoethanolamine transferase n=1 Tax=Rosenbergiella epipactidis TaxID=1544694 RepID=UPI002025E487|nr:phosphoethanolamine transferase [Rosenbergiella epipactidis]MCL9668530.1 phosphoethanolamine transferase [Rosenbergiella epipactidis]